MNDPFLVLGIKSDASDEEIKKAYRTKCKQYHPDLHPDDPTAEAHFKEVQEAYSQIMNIKSGKASYSSSYGGYGSYSGGTQQRTGSQYRAYTDPFGFGGFGFGFDPFEAGGFGGQRYSTQEESNELRAAGNYIRSGHYTEAMNALNSVPANQRQGRWYYYSALSQAGLGNNVNALESIRKALDFEPDNPEYQQLLQMLQNNVTGYRTYTNRYTGPSGMPVSTFGSGNFCIQLLLWNLLCNCLCGGCGGGGFYRV